MALFNDAARNIDNFKKDIRTYLVYYSALAAAAITYKTQECSNFPGILFWLFIGAILCHFLIWDIYIVRIKGRRLTLRRVFLKFTDVFAYCRNPRDKLFKTVTHKGPADSIVYHIQLLYPFIVFLVTWATLYPKEISLFQTIGLIGIIALLDFIFLNKTMCRYVRRKFYIFRK